MECRREDWSAALPGARMAGFTSLVACSLLSLACLALPARAADSLAPDIIPAVRMRPCYHCSPMQMGKMPDGKVMYTLDGRPVTEEPEGSPEEKHYKRIINQVHQLARPAPACTLPACLPACMLAAAIEGGRACCARLPGPASGVHPRLGWLHPELPVPNYLFAPPPPTPNPPHPNPQPPPSHPHPPLFFPRCLATCGRSASR